jgi:magnesium transporter
MIRYFQLENNQLKPVKETDSNKISWCDLLQPTDDELMAISQKFNVNIDDLEDCLDESERPHYSFDFILKCHQIVLRAIQTKEKDPNETLTIPIGLFYTSGNKLITVHNAIPNNFQKISDVLSRQTVESALFILLEMVFLFSTQLDQAAQKISNKIRGMQKSMMNSTNAADIQRPFELNSQLIIFNTEVLADMNSIKTFNAKNKSLFEGNAILMDKYDEVQTELEQIYAFTSIYRDLMANSLDSYASIINNNVTSVMKIVGSLQLIFSIPMLIASIYGMNIYMPGSIEQGSYLVFVLIIIVTIMLSAYTWRIFKRKNWL